MRSNWSVRASWRARVALDAALSRQPIDALFFHSQVTALFSGSLMRHRPAVVSLDATPINYDSVGEHYRHRPAGNGLIDRQKHAMNRRVFESASALIAWSEWAKRSLVNDYGVDAAAVRVIAPGAAQMYFELGKRRAGLAPKGPAERVRLLFVGGDFERKGGLLLLESMRGSLGERCELDVVTNAPVPSQRNVRVHRNVAPNSPELCQLFEAADVFVLPTHADCLALVLMEATAAGLPVVATNVGALSEGISPGASGLIIEANDVSALTQALETLSADARLRERMGRAGHDLARIKFDARRNNAAVLDVITHATDDARTLRRVA
jgi:glycosyltransferase involved in cell wall biosynthesis